MTSARAELSLGAAATLSLGVPFLLIAVAQQAMSTPVMAATRVVLAALALLALHARTGRSGLAEVLGLLRRRPVPLLAVAITAAVLPNLLIGAAERHVPSGTTAVVLATTPLWIAIGAALTRSGEHAGPRQWTALPFAILGVALACGAAIPRDSWAWALLPLAAAISYAVSSLTLRHHLAGARALTLTTAEMLIGSAVLVPVAAALPGELRWDPTAWAAVAVAGIGCSGLGWMANNALVQRVGASRASIVSYTAVVVSVALGVVVLGEPVTPQVAAGTAILVASVIVFLSRGPLRRPFSRKARLVLELCILGFLAGSPLHAYELRRRISALAGHVRRVSDGALTPALKRLEARGLIDRHAEPGEGGPPRIVFRLTDAGHVELRRRLAHPAPLDITDRSRWFTVLAFLHHLPDAAGRRVVLEQRLAFLEEPSRGFFVPDEAPLDGPAATFRDGMNTMARGIWRAEHDWLRRTLAAPPA